MKEISVIVPCYNVEEYIDTCVDSLVSQTLGLERMELIFIDDASQDNTLEILTAWEEKYPDNIMVITCGVNGKQGTARNIGMQYATGEYIGFVDSDDWVEADMFEELLEKAKLYHCDMVSCYAYRNKVSGHQVPEIMREEKLIQRDCAAIQGGSWPVEFLGNVWGKIYRRDILLENAVFFPEGLCYEDNYFTVVSALYCKNMYRLSRCLYHYRENNTSTTLLRNNTRLFDRLDIEVMKIEKFRELNILDRFYEQIEKDFFELYYFNTMFMMATRFDTPSYEIYQRMEKEIFQYFPDYAKNEELMQSGNEVWNLMLKVLDKHFTEEQFYWFMKQYAGLSRK